MIRPLQCIPMHCRDEWQWRLRERRCLARIFLATFIIVGSACDGSVDRPLESKTEQRVSAQPPSKASAFAGSSATNYQRELQALTSVIASLARKTATSESAMLSIDLAGLYEQRAQLTGDYEDYGRAGALYGALARGSVAMPEFCLARAGFEYTLHRLQAAAEALAHCPAGIDYAAVAGLRGDLAFYSGRYQEAESIYRGLLNQTRTSQNYVRMAHLRNKTGSPGEAAALMSEAEKQYHGTSASKKAWFKLQRGLIALDQGRLDEALALYRQGEQAFPGWWLVEEHIAEALRHLGKTEEAKAIYRRVIESTGAPEYMDALAVMLYAEGDVRQASELFHRATTIFDDRLVRYPEAAAGHALEHYLQDGQAPDRALRLAERNFLTRSYGEAAIGLARAWLRKNEPRKALPILEHQTRTGWDTAELDWVLSEAWGQLGDLKQMEQHRRRALIRNQASETLYALSVLNLSDQ